LKIILIVNEIFKVFHLDPHSHGLLTPQSRFRLVATLCLVLFRTDTTPLLTPQADTFSFSLD